MAQHNQKSKFKYIDPTGINRRLRIALLAHICVYILILAFTTYETIALMGASSLEAYYLDNILFDTIFSLIVVVGVIILITTAIIFARWQYRALANLISAGLKGIEIKPGWSIGFYFIPILNLFIPRRSMKEIWFGYRDFKNGLINVKTYTAPTLINTWWVMWVISTRFDNVNRVYFDEPETLAEIISFNYFLLFESLFFIVLGSVTLNMIEKIHQNQAKVDEYLRNQPPFDPEFDG